MTIIVNKCYLKLYQPVFLSSDAKKCQQHLSIRCTLPDRLAHDPVDITTHRTLYSVTAVSNAKASDMLVNYCELRLNSSTCWMLAQRPMLPGQHSVSYFLVEKTPTTSPNLVSSAMENMHLISTKALNPTEQALQPLLKCANHQVYHLMHVC